MRNATGRFYQLVQAVKKVDSQLAFKLKQDNVNYCSKQFANLLWYQNKYKDAIKRLETENPDLAKKLEEIMPYVTEEWS